MASLPPALRYELQCDTRAIEAALQHGVTAGRHSVATAYATIWRSFCQQHNLDPYLATSPDPIAWLQIFAGKVRDGRLSASGKSVRSSTVAEALGFVAQTFTFVGAPDPRFAPHTGRLDPRLSRLLRSYSKSDPAPVRVKPIPIAVLHHAFHLASLTRDVAIHAAADLMWLAFFFLLRPGEYSGAATDSHPFIVADVQLWAGTVPVDPLTAPVTLLLRCTFVALTFATQKNGVRAEQIGHGATSHPSACPVLCVVRRFIYLRSLSAGTQCPLCAIGPSFSPLPSSTITKLLRDATLSLGTVHESPLSSITARSLRASGATALLNRRVDSNTIQLLGRWHSDSMLRYLHVQAHSAMQHFSSIMLQGGDYTLIPSAPATGFPLSVPDTTPIH